MRRISSAVLAVVLLLSGCAGNASRAADFSLTADDGRPWTLSAQHGHAVLLTFGFTHCADTCPETLGKLAHLRRALGPSGDAVEIAMVTVDPHRDSVPVLRRFVERFDGPVTGLTGTPAQVARVENAYHVWSQRVPGHTAGSYDVVHSATIYFIDARGNVRDIHDDGESEADLNSAVRAML